MSAEYKPIPIGCTGGWEKINRYALVGGPLGTVFDKHVMLDDDGLYKMWYSWRPTRVIVYAQSKDGLEWTLPKVVLTFKSDSDWMKDEVNRPTMVKKDGIYHMWFTGQVHSELHGNDAYIPSSSIGYATSADGLHWQVRTEPVMKAELAWERHNILCSHVIWDKEKNMWRMWYSAGEKYEADAIGYAQSADGVHWEKHPDNPVFIPDKSWYWEMAKVEACFVIKEQDWHYMFYLGIGGDFTACIGLARSKDGITGWERHPENPVIAGSDGWWDYFAVCKMSVLKNEDGYLMWYNGVNSWAEELGLAFHKGHDLWPKKGQRPVRNYPEYQGIQNPLFSSRTGLKAGLGNGRIFIRG